MTPLVSGISFREQLALTALCHRVQDEIRIMFSLVLYYYIIFLKFFFPFSFFFSMKAGILFLEIYPLDAAIRSKAGVKQTVTQTV